MIGKTIKQIVVYTLGGLYDNNGGSIAHSHPQDHSYLKLENGSFILLEDGSKIKLED